MIYADLGEDHREGVKSKERKERSRLRRENRQLGEELEILKKAAAWFAREIDSIPRGPRTHKSQPG